MEHKIDAEKLVGEANATVGVALRVVLQGLPPVDQVEALVSLASALACVALAQHRASTGSKAGEFYDSAARYSSEMLADLVMGHAASHAGEA